MAYYIYKYIVGHDWRHSDFGTYFHRRTGQKYQGGWAKFQEIARKNGAAARKNDLILILRDIQKIS